MLPTLLFEEHYPPHKKIPLTKYYPSQNITPHPNPLPQGERE